MNWYNQKKKQQHNNNYPGNINLPWEAKSAQHPLYQTLLVHVNILWDWEFTRCFAIICSSPSKSCDLEPIPTWLLKLCLSELQPVISYIINLSLSTSTVPYELKLALITPLLKKVLLDHEVLKNFCPSSNLTFLLKIIELVTVVRLNRHLIQNGSMKFCRVYINKTTALKQLCSKYTMIFLWQLTHGGAIPILLDLSAAFDNIDHTILLQWLHELGIRGAALDW